MAYLPLPRTLLMRIMFGVAVLQFCVVGLFSAYLFFDMMGSEANNRQMLAQKIVSLSAPGIEHLLQTHDDKTLPQFLERLAGDNSVSGVTVKRLDGTVYFQRSKASYPLNALAAMLFPQTLNEVVNSDISKDGKPYGTLTVRLSNRPFNNAVENFLENIGLLFLILLGFNLLAMQLLIRHLVAPLKPLTELAMQIGEGKLDAVIDVSENESEEVVHLAQAFRKNIDVMRHQIDDLQEARRRLSASETRLRDLIDSMQEVLLELDREGRIVFLNPVWEALTGYSVNASLNQPFSSFVVQPVQQAMFVAARLQEILLRNLLIELRAHDGHAIWIHMNSNLKQDEQGVFSGVVCTLNDITELIRLQDKQRQHEAELYRLSITDPLTGLHNRRYFDEMLEQILHKGYQGEPLSLLIMDVDGFKFINDTYGHPVGDEVLRLVAEALQEIVPASATLVRMAGDEFAILLRDTTEAQATRTAQHLRQAVSRLLVPLAVGTLQVRCSIGVASAPTHGRQPQDLVRSADVALYHAKKSGRDRVDVLPHNVGEAIMDIFSQGFELRNALQAGMIAPFIQPIVNLQTREIFAYEVLTRLRRGDSYVAADEFIPIAEDLGLIREMDLHIIREALRRVPPKTHLFINISLSSFYNPEFATELKKILLSPAGREHEITIEFTERQTTAISEDFLNYFDDLREAGCRIALDDFGVGYSTYGYMLQVKPNYLKIDGSFVLDAISNELDAMIVRQIADIAVASSSLTIAEHIEDEATMQKVLSLGAHYGQGYYFGRPKLVEHYFPAAKMGGEA